MNKLLKKRIFIISISLAFLLLINIGISYSYFLGKVVGNETTTTLSFISAGVVIEYENNSGSITDSNIIPGWSTTKNFTVKSTMKENEGNNNETKLGYVVKMYVDNNEFSDNSIVYSLSLNGSIVGNGQAMESISDIGLATGVNSDGIILGIGYFVVGYNEHNYTLTIKYVDSDAVNGNKHFAIHLGVETVKPVTVTVDLNGGTYSGSTTKYIPLGIAVDIEEPTKEEYIFDGWKITSGNGSIEGNKILANSLALTVQAQYKLSDATIAITSVTGGTLTSSASTAAPGSSVTLTATPSSGYTYGGCTISYTENGVAKQTSLAYNVLTFTVPDSDVTITPKWAQLTTTSQSSLSYTLINAYNNSTGSVTVYYTTSYNPITNQTTVTFSQKVKHSLGVSGTLSITTYDCSTTITVQATDSGNSKTSSVSFSGSHKSGYASYEHTPSPSSVVVQHSNTAGSKSVKITSSTTYKPSDWDCPTQGKSTTVTSGTYSG